MRQKIPVILFCFLFLAASSAAGQVVPGTKYISINYGIVEGDLAVFGGLSGQIREDMGIEVLLGMVPSRGHFSDLYSLVRYQYHLWPRNRIVPHLAGGAGAITVVGWGSREVDFVLSFGGGITTFITPNLALRFDVDNHSVFFENETDNKQAISGGVVLIF